MNLTGQPIRQKTGHPTPDPEYLAAVRQLSCCICEAWGLPQMSITTAHHPICGRGGSRKAPDRHAIPLCDGHHQGTWDTSKVAIHRERREWVRLYGVDADYIAGTQDRVDQMRGPAGFVV